MTALVGAVGIAVHSAGADDWTSIDAGFAVPPAEYRLIQFGGHDGALLPMNQMATAGIGGVQLFMQSIMWLYPITRQRAEETQRKLRAALH